MTQATRRKFWPYDEVTASRDPSHGDRFILSAPWLTFQFDVDSADVAKADLITKKMSAGQVTPADLDDLNWLFSSLAAYPFAYILPRTASFGIDQHDLLAPSIDLKTPAATLATLTENAALAATLSQDWSWDLTASLEFSKTESGYDPETLFSVARRFHLLNDLESNQTAELLAYMAGLLKNSPAFCASSALVMRQNHYITEKCEVVLSAALPISKNAQPQITKFIQAERGHDKILKKAMLSLGAEADNVPVLDCVSLLMELFGTIAQKNLLAFSMVVDMFERTSYRREDPFAKVLQDGGAAQAASQIEIHRDINDAGGHENVAIEFLQYMRPISQDYAIEALRLAELLTQILHLISKDTLTRIKAAP